jgi:hypothetical protein
MKPGIMRKYYKKLKEFLDTQNERIVHVRVSDFDPMQTAQAYYFLNTLAKCRGDVVIRVYRSDKVKYYIIDKENYYKLTEDDLIMCTHMVFSRKPTPRDMPGVLEPEELSEGEPNTQLVPISVLIPAVLREEIQKLIDKGYYPNLAEFVREAVRVHLLKFLRYE